MAAIVFIQTTLFRYLPREIRSVIHRRFLKIFQVLIRTKTFTIWEHEKHSPNKMFESALCYLSYSKSLSSPPALFRLSKLENTKTMTRTFDGSEEVEDVFNGIKVCWKLHRSNRRTTKYNYNAEERWLELSFNKKDFRKVLTSYLPNVRRMGEELSDRDKVNKLHRIRYAEPRQAAAIGVPLWRSAALQHPATFETVAMDPEMKKEIREDLDKFVKRKEYYKKVGRAWKRGYLLYGPPGTGKTSLVAAIANYLRFDVYDIELTAVDSNSKLQELLLSTSKKSVVVIEDVDCSVDLSRKGGGAGGQKRKEPSKSGGGGGGGGGDQNLTLSGVLNVLDGLWSSCGEERLIILTTNDKEGLDPALVRAGRMDKHIHMSYCGFPAFKMLAKNYLNVDEGHRLMEEAEKLLPEAKMTPAEVAEVFLPYGEDGELGMKSVVEEMKKRLPPISLLQKLLCALLKRNYPVNYF